MSAGALNSAGAVMHSTRLRTNEVAVALPEEGDASLFFVGKIRTPWKSRSDTPRQGSELGPLCTLEISEPWAVALKGVEAYSRLEILYWLHESPRDIVLLSPADDGEIHGAFSLRAPVRPNPIGTSIVKVERVSGNSIVVRGLDCLDGTPLLDIKPDRSLSKPLAPVRKSFSIPAA
ncbi:MULTISPECIES: tRNA (N6-threonylcarbamoyladenosine(37)-N6)-methyltransferase TrmO [Rhizobium/Agrobacterium group]|uniref:Probable S-adenosyl-L-methionine-binding protein VirR n=4 Tax=Agrobacterium TaxID=357 RepID=VIRR_AGRTU|nr:RecName: Full=Probable S-adenosyl-L-methionine-binding protein VirR; AltName: Full=Protein VirR [Agrobacterium tumefaciens]AHK05322.1 VirR [Agrobacterium tumefaciens LBA4213 (Ach5)]AKC11051.1 VirH [Agrobacterium tumefaciens]ASK42824.1 tRNA (N6-threonylcarbamoyladenosine(37)-N6)-methyltransferase TrmO [Agrobacterium sp.]ASK47202.1 tRNA (N6-threonylcarbamoyladenosine(37)-N6)-methyltransferase TrmO [Agrobacterium radiobacter]ASK49579.1 tRNA (N6-threonylcarbamoyladenosine(37)-N6)-methyltransfer